MVYGKGTDTTPYGLREGALIPLQLAIARRGEDYIHSSCHIFSYTDIYLYSDVFNLIKIINWVNVWYHDELLIFLRCDCALASSYICVWLANGFIPCVDPLQVRRTAE